MPSSGGNGAGPSLISNPDAGPFPRNPQTFLTSSTRMFAVGISWCNPSNRKTIFLSMISLGRLSADIISTQAANGSPAEWSLKPHLGTSRSGSLHHVRFVLLKNDIGSENCIMTPVPIPTTDGEDVRDFAIVKRYIEILMGIIH